MKPLKVKISLTLDSDLVEKLKADADADDRSFSQYVNRLLKEAVSAASDHKQPAIPNRLPHPEGPVRVAEKPSDYR